jgi:hypothetical protein
MTGIKDCLKWLFGLVFVKGELERLSCRVNNIELMLMRSELILLMHTAPYQTMYIVELYDKYKKAGGNGVIDNLYRKWYNKYVKNKKIVK